MERWVRFPQTALMEMAREDFLRVRELCAEQGDEMTPDEMLELLNEVQEVVLVDEPGIVSYIRELRKDEDNG